MDAYLYLRSGARGLQKLPFLKYYNVLEWKNRFNLGLYTAKITDYIFKKNCSELNFLQKPQWTHICLSQKLS